MFNLKNQPEVIKSYEKDAAPLQVIKTNDQWVMLNGIYGGQNYSISVSRDLESANSIYSVNDVSIWYFEANDAGIVWCEKSSDFYTYKVYTFESQTVETFFQTTTDVAFQPQNVGIYLNAAYCCTIDYEQQIVRVLAYDLVSKTTTDVYTTAFQEKDQPYSINLDNDHLSFVCSGQVKVFHLPNMDVVFESALPDATEHVFSVSYDVQNDTCALYYADNDSEDIGILKEGDQIIRSVFTFSQHYYAYQDKIECADGHIYWIAQANVSGNIADHYTFVDYNYLDHKPTETERTFSFYRDGSNLYMLRFNNNNNYTHIDLCRNQFVSSPHSAAYALYGCRRCFYWIFYPD
jgi:hypothetical protein